jgi:hypothetical protein
MRIVALILAATDMPLRIEDGFLDVFTDERIRGL